MGASEVRIISESSAGVRVCAASARISTTEGGALECFERGDGGDKDKKLISKVLASGHKTITEHAVYSVAFNNVSVLVEQFVIEFRLASYTVKSRRYVNFSGAGFVVPDDLPENLREVYISNMRARFASYDALIALGIAREDARFVLPYCFRSNFYMTANARELMHMARQMSQGRGAIYPEIRALGESLINQLNARLPDADMDLTRVRDCARAASPDQILDAVPAHADAELMGTPSDARTLLNAALTFSNRFAGRAPEDMYKALARDKRPRELELINYTFRVKRLSLACLTHFTRHRMLSLITRAPVSALAGGEYVIPPAVSARAEALNVYKSTFEQNARDAQAMLSAGASLANLSYYALAGNVTDIIVSMNARELMHFFRLRTCARAQWEIRQIASDMLSLLMEEFSALFKYYGPSCAVLGHCPEGRLSCKNARGTEE